MSGKTRKKKSGRRKIKRLEAMRADELRRHAESGRDYSAPRGAPHVGHTRHQKGRALEKTHAVTSPRWNHQARLGRVWLKPSAGGQKKSQ
jgi:hypothetical protein